MHDRRPFLDEVRRRKEKFERLSREVLEIEELDPNAEEDRLDLQKRLCKRIGVTLKELQSDDLHILDLAVNALTEKLQELDDPFGAQERMHDE